MSEEGRVEAPERIYLRACHPASPGRNCKWIASETPEDSVEYVRAQPPTADEEMVAREVVAQWKRDIGKVINYKQMEADIARAISAAKQQGRDEQREKDARLAEMHPNCPEGCNFDIVQAIRSNQ